jgi:hypothetical protein
MSPIEKAHTWECGLRLWWHYDILALSMAALVRRAGFLMPLYQSIEKRHPKSLRRNHRPISVAAVLFVEDS